VVAQKCVRLPADKCTGTGSVDSERLVSNAADVLTDIRSLLLPERAEELIILKVSMLLLGIEYD